MPVWRRNEEGRAHAGNFHQSHRAHTAHALRSLRADGKIRCTVVPCWSLFRSTWLAIKSKVPGGTEPPGKSREEELDT
jgi:hypothetical protein